MLTNRDLIKMHLEQLIRDFPGQSWDTILGYCVGYYDKIDMEIILVVRELQREGKIN
jgi:hypothetical protein